MPQLLFRNESQRGVAETLAEPAAAVVRLRGNFERGRPRAQPAAGWQVGRRQIELEAKIVAEEHQWLTVGNQLGDVDLHYRKLCFRGGTSLAAPCVTGDSGLRRHARSRKRLSTPSRTSLDQQADASGITRCRRQLGKPRLENVK